MAGNSCVAWTGWKPDLSPVLPAHVAQRLKKESNKITYKRSCGCSRSQEGKQQLWFIYQHMKQLDSLSVGVTVDSSFVESVVKLELSEPSGLQEVEEKVETVQML